MQAATVSLVTVCKQTALSHSLIRYAESEVVGRGGLEPPTSRLSGVRSNHLSYRPSVHPADARDALAGSFARKRCREGPAGLVVIKVLSMCSPLPVALVTLLRYALLRRRLCKERLGGA